MPVKNGFPYLPHAIRSTLRALPNDAELVVLNDASTDRTAPFLDAQSDRRIRVITNSESSGVASGLNQLLDATDSQYVARMDADDICFHGRFRHQLRRIDKLDFSFTSVIFINSNGRPTRPDSPGTISADAVGLHLLLGNILVHPTMLARRSAIDQMGGYAKTSAEDYDLWLRSVVAGMRIERSGTPTLFYRRHPKQVSATGAWLRLAEDPLLDSSFTEALSSELHTRFSNPSGIRMARSTGDSSSVSVEDQLLFVSHMVEASKRLGALQKIQLNLRLRSIR